MTISMNSFWRLKGLREYEGVVLAYLTVIAHRVYTAYVACIALIAYVAHMAYIYIYIYI